MTTAAARGPLALVLHQSHYDLRGFLRNRQARFFTLALPLLFLVVFVSVFGSDTGGTLANVNRWRRELGLRDIDDAGLPPMIAPLDPSEPEARLVDLTNNNRRLVAAIVPRDGQYWFYKLRGDIAAVSPERDAFVAFAKSKP